MLLKLNNFTSILACAAFIEKETDDSKFTIKSYDLMLKKLRRFEVTHINNIELLKDNITGNFHIRIAFLSTKITKSSSVFQLAIGKPNEKCKCKSIW